MQTISIESPFATLVANLTGFDLSKPLSPKQVISAAEILAEWSAGHISFADCMSLGLNVPAVGDTIRALQTCATLGEAAMFSPQTGQIVG